MYLYTLCFTTQVELSNVNLTASRYSSQVTQIN
jgi:hypothetical protein